ncbi:N-acetylglutaminylglutamine synthetase [Geoalkalibacter halelectricus]|uniref:N-acetylglutaminylglutamine synthetase n=1 Tax=Geoalkalibacter halelectricus TaxID=2847045 RepID=A0ABY5ZL71_9BACT|nr:N-acetylglutaminylglutamine synthetase [Geoalkalibacter halelectricus]MDO3378880.1 N-acetylglutaminylglutamine synthetase [Geoalkalibacter halelectricus]UWZ79818.1 N-acetylglutaminylglutamine synthetase [Geoalkalibacter halelectricus]
MADKKNRRHRFERLHSPTLRSWTEPSGPQARKLPQAAEIDCGWGRLIFAHTFSDPQGLADALCHEERGRRDVALYVPDPHVVLSKRPQELFLDPSDTYRLWLSDYRPAAMPPRGFVVRRLQSEAEAAEINRIYAARQMVPVDPDFVWRHRGSRVLTYLVAVDEVSGEIIGTATGVDHRNAFADPENGSSLWCLAVAPQSPHPGVGQALTEYLAGHFLARGRAFMDLSVLHENRQAIALYAKMGFQRIPAFCIKHKNPINEPLFMGPSVSETLNPYAAIIVDEARRRGIVVEILDAANGFFALSHGGRTVHCRESLSQLTDAVAMSRCDDKEVTWRILQYAGLRLPRQRQAGDAADNAAFLAECGALVVKPARGEQGKGVCVNLRTLDEVTEAVEKARQICAKVLLEEYVPGQDLRVIVIDFAVVAAAVRRPPCVVGNGRHTVRELIEKQSRRRAAATGGESTIPLDAETERCVMASGHRMDEVLPAQKLLTVRDTANLHTGATIHDLTDQVHPELKQAAVAAARALDIPVVGLDFIVPKGVDSPEYVIIEANERPGLANHEPAPTAQRFIDLLFPQTVR